MIEKRQIQTPEETQEIFNQTLIKLRDKYQGTDYYIDEDEFKTMATFMILLRLPEGEFAGLQIPYNIYQTEFSAEMICIRKKKDGYRKHSSGLLFVSRKFGKSTFMGVLLLFYLFIDKAKGKQLYCVSNETQQAMLVFNAAKNILTQNKSLVAKSNIWKSTKMIDNNKDGFSNFVKVLSGNADTADGKSSDLVIFDELHQAKSPEMFNAMNESMAAKPNAQMMIISTAGYNRQGVMHQKYIYAKQVKAGIIKDESFYSMIFELDEGDDWNDETTWYKSNPTLGLPYGVSLDFLRSQYTKALHSGADEVSFKCKHLNMWVNAATVWIKDEIWTANQTKQIPLESLRGRSCYGGLDLSSTTDITALVLVFPSDDGSLDVIRRYWIPEDNMRERARKDRVPYIDWHRDGHILSTSGNVVDYDFIEKEIIELSEIVQIETLHYDRWNSANLANHLVDNGINAVGFGQGFASMSNPTKMIETLALQNKINHENDPVLRWMCSNVSLQTDSAGNIKVDKSKSRERVDGMVALAMAVGAWLTNKPKETTSPYESGEVRFM